MTFAVLIDIILLAIIAASAVKGWRDGLISSLMGFVGLIVAYIGASGVARILTSKVSEMFFRSGMTRIVGNVLSEVELPVASEELEKIGEAVKEGLSEIGLPDNVISKVGGGFLEKTLQGETVLEVGLDTVIADKFAYCVIFISVFIVLMLVVIIIMSVINGLFSFPLLKEVNIIGGIAVGLLFGVMVAFSISIAATWFYPFLARTFELPAISELLEDTILLRFFALNNPFEWLLL